MQPFWLLFYAHFQKEGDPIISELSVKQQNNIGGKKEYAKEDCESI